MGDKRAVALYVSAGYKLRISLGPYNVTRLRLVTLYGSTGHFIAGVLAVCN